MSISEGRKFFSQSKTKRECVAALRSGALFGLGVVYCEIAQAPSVVVALNIV